MAQTVKTTNEKVNAVSGLAIRAHNLVKQSVVLFVTGALLKDVRFQGCS